MSHSHFMLETCKSILFPLSVGLLYLRRVKGHFKAPIFGADKVNLNLRL